MDIFIITGMSGSGKSSVIKAMEDLGYFCADNIPPSLFHSFIKLINESDLKPEKIGIVVDGRLKSELKKIDESLNVLKENGYSYKIIFVDTDNDVLLRRYKETRRLHPLSNEYNNSLKNAIAAERELLNELKANADFVFDTTNLSSIQFVQKIKDLFTSKISDIMNITSLSFGYKYGIPRDCDLVFDVRCLPNPFYIPDLKYKTGLEKEVRDYVMKNEESKEFLEKIINLVNFLLPLYIKENKSNLVIGFGCTGGKHRSVTFAEMSASYLKKKGYKVTIDHRDVKR